MNLDCTYAEDSHQIISGFVPGELNLTTGFKNWSWNEDKSKSVDPIEKRKINKNGAIIDQPLTCL